MFILSLGFNYTGDHNYTHIRIASDPLCTFRQYRLHQMYIRTCTYMYMYVHVHVYMYTCIHVCMYIYMYMYMYMYIHVHVCICTYRPYKLYYTQHINTLRLYKVYSVCTYKSYKLYCRPNMYMQTLKFLALFSYNSNRHIVKEILS